jgi:tRNA (guanine26-N2/guanine27-N2)-dimethyltransferase
MAQSDVSSRSPSPPLGGRQEGEGRPHREGASHILLPPGPLRPERLGPARRAPVFYNPAMSFTRDLDVAVLRAVALERGRRLSVWETLAASGIRSVRWLTETTAVERLLATELNPDALRYLERNLRPWDHARALGQDARHPEFHERFDWVDLDPYGTPAPFLPAAVQRLQGGGILSVTATDTAVLAGPERKACLTRYGARPLRTYLCREAGLRILLGHVSSVAAREGLGVRPLLCYGRDHHFRLYLRTGPLGESPPVREVPFPGYAGPPIPEGRRGGPLWTGPLFDPGFLHRLEVPASAEQGPAVGAWLELLREESNVDGLFYYEVGEVCKSLGLPQPPGRTRILTSFRDAGWKVARTHWDPSGFRTEAPWADVAPRIAGLSSAP